MNGLRLPLIVNRLLVLLFLRSFVISEIRGITKENDHPHDLNQWNGQSTHAPSISLWVCQTVRQSLSHLANQSKSADALILYQSK